MLPIDYFPMYIRNVVDLSVPVNYEWDDEDPESYFVIDDIRLAKRIAQTTAHGIAALSIACTEWIVYRFSTLSDDPMPYHYIEAAWAGLINQEYMNLKHEQALRDWRGRYEMLFMWLFGPLARTSG